MYMYVCTKHGEKTQGSTARYTVGTLQRSIERTDRTESQSSKNRRADRGWLFVFVQIDRQFSRPKRT